jgi:hypothetical protein
VSVLAAIRPGDVNLALFVHVLGAMLLVGTLLASSSALLIAWRRADPGEEQALTRFGLRVLLIGVLPSYVVMRGGAQWVESQENLPDDFDPTWIGIGYITADAGVLLLLISTVLSAIGLRRLRDGRGTGLGRAVAVIATLLLAAYVVATWAMSAKPD